MGWVQAGFLAALAALAVPIVVHLMAGRQARRVDLGTLRFLKIALRENVRRRRVKRWVLLALRMACVALLAVLFARPYLVAGQSRDADRLVVALLDRSASMALASEGGRLLDAGVRKVKAIVAQCGEGAEVRVACFDHAVHPLRGTGGGRCVGSDSRERFEGSIATLDSLTTSSSTDYGAAMAWARDVCIGSRCARKELYVLTDLQRSGLDRTACEPLPADVKTHLFDLGQSHPANMAVTRITLQKTMVRPDETVIVDAAVLNAGPFLREGVPVVLRMSNGTKKRTVRSTIDLDAGESSSVRFKLTDLAEGMWSGRIEVEAEDDLPFDNSRCVALKVAAPLHVTLIDGDPGDSPYAAETYFLETALRLALPGDSYSDSPFEPKTVAPAKGAGLPSLEGAELVVLANVARLSPADGRRLTEFVGQGGGLLVFTGGNVEADSYRTLDATGMDAGRIVGEVEAASLPWRFESWAEGHPVFEPFRDPETGDLRRLAFRAYTRIQPAAEALVLAKFRGGDPAVVERQYGRGKVLWFLSACDGDWRRSRLYVPLVHQMLAYLAGRANGGPVRNLLTDDARFHGDDSIPGVFDRGGYCEVINVNPRESELDRCSRKEFAARFQVQLQEDDDRRAGEANRAGADLRPDEVWHWVLLCLLAVLFLESFLANRTTA